MGASLSCEEENDLLAAFRAGWPRKYGEKSSGKGDREVKHREAVKALIEKVWPARTYLSFMRGLTSRPQRRAKFHEQRLKLAEGKILFSQLKNCGSAPLPAVPL